MANEWLDAAAACGLIAAASLILMIGTPVMKNRVAVQHPRLSQRKAVALAGVRARLVVSYLILGSGIAWAAVGLWDSGLFSCFVRLFVTACVAPIPCAPFLHHIHDTEF
ncbi:hypothetical protein Nazgul08 [Burkholderia phage BcepNazgul]|uniref:Uncharacterized protein n=1 Tax=Burkholderia phage BcepNazgul TaxID=242861 RepID=Q6UYF7_9CAUD|nr:hypothetical protein Nazgul08 [Burkholderia phage BcepNazgul]AAQ63384.1 hypothetical protein Nazgul08 [Burkholderia phage BcepNazgul]